MKRETRAKNDKRENSRGIEKGEKRDEGQKKGKRDVRRSGFKG